MKQKLQRLAMLMAMLLAFIQANAHDFEVDGIYYNKTSDSTVAVTYQGDKYSKGYYGNVVIPENIVYSGISYSVTSIGRYAFYDCNRLTSINIPVSVISIEDNAFEECTGLKSVTIPDSVISIGIRAFYCCKDLTSVTIPNFVISVGNYAFLGCSSLKMVTFNAEKCESFGEYVFPTLLSDVFIGEKVQYIPEQIFANCSSLTSVILPNSVTSIGSAAFYGCSGLTSIVLPDSIISIGGVAFYGCSSLTSVNIPNTLTTIGDYAFYGCYGLTSVIIPNSVTSIGSAAFYGCTNLKKSAYPSSITNPFDSGIIIEYPSDGSSIDDNGIIWGNDMMGLYFVPMSFHGDLVIPESVICIGNDTFNGCSNLTSVAIPNSVTTIGDSAFSGCSGLNSLTIPNLVTKLSDYMFSGCSSLHSLTLGSGITSLGKWSLNNSDHRPEKVVWLANTPPDNYYDYAGTVNYVANNNYKLLGKLTYIYDHLSSMFESDGIVYVPVNPSERTCDIIDCGYSEDAKNISLNRMVSFRGIEMMVNNIRPYAFYSNKYIENISIDREGVIPAYAFYGCGNIRAIEIPSTISDISEYAFRGCESATKIHLGNTGTIGTNAFAKSCSANFGTLVIAPSVTNIDACAFLDCTKLTSATINNNGSIGEYAFSGCSSLEKICVRNVGSIDNSAFNNCHTAKSLTIAPTVTSVRYNVFFGCSSIADVTIEDGDDVLSLGSNGDNPLFVNCPLDEVYIGRKLSYSTSSSSGYSPFYRNTSLRSVEISDVETQIYDNEFYGCTNLQDVKIGDGVKSFGKYAFSGCSKIESFEFGRAVESIGEEAFSDCTAMVSMVSHNPVPPTCGNEALDDINKWECTLHVPADALDAYKAADQWKNFFFINDDVTDSAYFEYEELCYRVLDGSHRMCEVVAQEEAPESVRMRVAGTQATNVMIPETVSRIGLRYTVKGIADNAFSSYSALEEVTIPATVEYVGNAAFAGCSQLTYVEVKAEVPPTAYSNSFDSVVYANATLTVPGESEALYKVADCWKEFARVETGVDSVFDDCVTETGRYSLDGSPVDANYRGIVVVRYSDGSTRKFHVTQSLGL